MKSKINYLPIITFYLIAISIRYLTDRTNLLDGIDNYFLKIILRGTGPAIGAIITFLAFKIKPVMTFGGHFKKIWALALLFWGLPIVMITISSYVINEPLPYGFILAVLLYGLFEEIGWRGFLHQALKPLPKIASILVVSVLWFVWHLNFELSIANLVFFGILVLGSWGIGKVADKTCSFLVVASFHSLNNFFHDLTVVNITILVVLTTTWILAIVLKDRFENRSAFKQTIA